MDERTLALLEFDRVRRLVAGRAGSELGRGLAMVLEPSADAAVVHERQAILAEMVEALEQGWRPGFAGFRDIRGLVRRAAVESVLEAEELGLVLDVVRAAADLARWVDQMGDRFPRLGGMKGAIGDFSELASTLDGCLDPRARVVDGASRRLSVLRAEIARRQEQIQETLRRLVRSSEIRRYLRYPNFTMVGHHFVLPVAREHRGEIPGSVLRASSSNETLYIEPAVIGEQSAQLSLLRAQEQKEVRRILRWLSARVGQVADSLLATLDAAAELDLIHAKARYALEYAMSRPTMEAGRGLVLKQARHPLLEALFRGDPALKAGGTASSQVESSPAESAAPAGASEPRRVTPIDLVIGHSYRMLVVTGPNTGGKTVALKTVGLLSVMAQAGLFVPADEGSRLPLFDSVLLDVGDEQSLEQSLSTFSAHVRRITEILGRATDRSLVLLDELGAGTDPSDGGALGRAILDELGEIGCLAIVSTHIGDLKSYAVLNPAAENAAVEFDGETLQPRYRILIGDVGASHALRIARHLQLPERVIDRASAWLAQSKSGPVPEWERLVEARREAEEARKQALEAELEARRMREQFVLKLAELEESRRRAEQLSSARARLEVGDEVIIPRLGADRPGRLLRLDVRKRMAKVAIGHVSWDVSLDEIVPRPRPG